jgi:transitional endoplasmic reticulum ATPase
LIASTNKPWDIDSAFVRPGRLGTRVYVGLPDEDSRRYMLEKRLLKLKNMGVVEVSDDIDLETIVQRTAGFNGSDIDNLFNAIEEDSAVRGTEVGKKYINMADFDDVFEKVKSYVQRDDIEKLMGWKAENG